MYKTITIVQWCSSIKQMTSEASFKFPLNFLLLLQVTSSGTLKIISISLQNFHFAKGFAKVQSSHAYLLILFFPNKSQSFYSLNSFRQSLQKFSPNSMHISGVDAFVCHCIKVIVELKHIKSIFFFFLSEIRHFCVVTVFSSPLLPYTLSKHFPYSLSKQTNLSSQWQCFHHSIPRTWTLRG